MSDRDKFNQAIIGIVIIAIFIFIGINRSLNLNKDPKYTVGIVKKFLDGRGGRSIIFEYNVNNKLYKGSNSINFKDQSLVGKKFTVKFFKKNPNTAKLLLNFPVPDTLKTIPINGWDELPVLK